MNPQLVDEELRDSYPLLPHPHAADLVPLLPFRSVTTLSQGRSPLTFRKLPFVVKFQTVLLALAYLTAAGATTVYVSPEGHDERTGSIDEPLASLAGARNRVRQLRVQGVAINEVVFAGGTYRFDTPVGFEERDSGSAQAPIVYRAMSGQQVRFSGGAKVTGWSSLTDEVVSDRLLDNAGEHILVADLRAQGLVDYGEIMIRPGTHRKSEPELFWGDEPLTLARYPNEGFRGIHEISENLREVKLDTDRALRWTAENDPWIMAYWFYDWSEQFEPIVAIDPRSGVVSRSPEIDPRYGVSPGKARWYAFNLLSELDRPGEYYLDREQGLAYCWPPREEIAEAVLSTSTGIIQASEVSHVTFRGITMEACRGSAIEVSGGGNVHIIGCTIRNTGRVGIRVTGGVDHVIYGCDVYNTGSGGISMRGGDRRTLTPSRFNVENNHVHAYARRKRTYRPAILVNGVGSRIAHNLINDGPHMALMAEGNDHLIEYNEIHNVVYESGDAGAYYVGRDWTMRGVVLRYNYWHHIVGIGGHGGMTVYLDDQHCGHTIHGNLFVRCSNAAFLGGGDDNIVTNNVFIDCRSAAHLDNRGGGSIEETLLRTLDAMPYQSAVWRDRYPTLATILDDDPHLPKRNVFARNISAGGMWDDIDDSTRHLQTIDANLVFDEDSEWVTLQHDTDGRPLSLTFKDPAAVDSIGFASLPLAKIGLYEDVRRASWPVVHEVKPVEFREPPPRADLESSPVFVVPYSKVPVVVDGSLDAAEWFELDEDAAMSLAVNVNGNWSSPVAHAWMSHDGTNLRIGVTTALAPTRHLSSTWGLSDAVELAFRDEDEVEAAVLVFRGYTEDTWTVSMEEGTPPTTLDRLSRNIRYSAGVLDDRWVAEWQVPFENIGAQPGRRLRFNLSIRRIAGNVWLMWRPTYGHTYDVWATGSIELAPTPSGSP